MSRLMLSSVSLFNPAQMSAYIPTLHGFAKLSLQVTGGLLGLAATALYFGQTYLIYPAYIPPGSRENVATPADYEIPFENLELVASDGVLVKAYLMKQRKTLVGHAPEMSDNIPPSEQTDDEYASTRPTVLLFHANAGNVGHRLPLGRMFYAQMRCNVLMLSYRGYGLSKGSPSEKGIRLDAQTILDFVRSHDVLQNTQLILYGQSIGGAVAIDLASRNPAVIHALVLENTFLSIPLIARRVMPLVTPFLFLCTEQWNSQRSIKLIPPTTHILLLSGLNDELVPPEHMKELWNVVALPKEKDLGVREWAEFPYGTHNDTCVQPDYWDTVADFVNRITS